MKKLIVLPLIIALLFIGKKSWGYYNKYHHANRIKVGVESFNFPTLNLSSLLSDIELNINIELGNFSPSTFNITQINVDVFDVDGKLIAEQTTPLKNKVVMTPNENTTLPLAYNISSGQLNNLIMAAGGYISVGQNYITSGKYGIKINLKGFVDADGFTIAINETMTV